MGNSWALCPSRRLWPWPKKKAWIWLRSRSGKRALLALAALFAAPWVALVIAAALTPLPPDLADARQPSTGAVLRDRHGVVIRELRADDGARARWVPLDASGEFFAPLWTDLRLGPPTGVIDWYTLPVGLLAFAALTMHGSLWIALKTEGPLAKRARRFAASGWTATVFLTVVVSALTFPVQPLIPARMSAHPGGLVLPALAFAGLAGVRWFRNEGDERNAFLSSALFLGGLLASTAFALYPYVLPANTDPGRGLTVFNSAAADHGLRVALWWWVPGMLLVLGYFVLLYRNFAGKVRTEGAAEAAK